MTGDLTIVSTAMAYNKSDCGILLDPRSREFLAARRRRHHEADDYGKAQALKLAPSAKNIPRREMNLEESSFAVPITEAGYNRSLIAHYCLILERTGTR
jgi:hypothetical protein